MTIVNQGCTNLGYLGTMVTKFCVHTYVGPEYQTCFMLSWFLGCWGGP